MTQFESLSSQHARTYHLPKPRLPMLLQACCIIRNARRAHLPEQIWISTPLHHSRADVPNAAHRQNDLWVACGYMCTSTTSVLP